MHAATYNTSTGRWVKDICLPANQRDCNSCWAIATCQCMSDRLRLQRKIGMSDQLNYYAFFDYMYDHDPSVGSCNQGAYDNTGRIESVDVGAPLFSVAPDSHFGVPEYRGDRLLYHYKARSWYKLDTPEAIKSDLDHNGSVTCIIALYNSWMNHMGLGIYTPRPNEQPNGELHMISIVGYDNNDGSWIVRNSYGSNWGSQGFTKIKQTDQKLNVLNSVYAPVV